MSNRIIKKLTSWEAAFLVPSNATHRQYEALRAFFVDKLPSSKAAERFGYSPASFRTLCHQFRKDPSRPFFMPSGKGPHNAPKTNKLRGKIVALRKKNLSVYDISDALYKEEHPLSPAMVAIILKEDGFARLPRRADDERPATSRPDAASVADIKELNLNPRRFRTQLGGLFLFLPFLAKIPLDQILNETDFPGSSMIPAGAAMRSLLALKLFGNARYSHIMSQVFDEGLALFAGLNVIPKRSFLTEYSCRIDPRCYPQLMHKWFKAVTPLGLKRGKSFDLDFHTIPFHGEDALVEKHYVSKRSRRQKGILAFLAQDDDRHVFCYANAHLRKEQQPDEILNFIEFWKQRTKRLPEELVFDSKLTTYRNLNRLNQMGIRFITLRRRSEKMLERIRQIPSSQWRRIELKSLSRTYRTPRILDERVTLKDYDGYLRQITIIDLGHEDPTILITNQMRLTPVTLIERYAKRMIIENNIEDGIDFFHMDALSSAVALKINCDLQLTLMASSLYRLLADRIGQGYQRTKSRHLFRDFVNATAVVHIQPEDIQVKFHKRAHNPLLVNAGFANLNVRVPWLGHKRLHLVFG